MSASRIGRYEILRPLGRGAMGVVYLARDPQIERELALKTVRFDGPQASFNLEESKARFLKEARISGRLQHPHIVTVFDVGEDGGTLYLAMEYVSGGSLSQKLAKPGELTVEDRIRIVAEVAAALGHAHERGVIHRDIKPANILLTPSLSAKVTDFGIGKFLAGDTDLTSTGQMVGSPSYMSPEQIRGEKLDVRSDIFSLGVVLYQVLTERKPFPADTLTTLVYQILHEEPPDPIVLRGDLPPQLTGIIKKCLAKHRDDRYTDAVELAADLGAVIGLPAESATTGFSESVIRRRSARTGPQPGINVEASPSLSSSLPPANDSEPTLASGARPAMPEGPTPSALPPPKTSISGPTEIVAPASKPGSSSGVKPVMVSGVSGAAAGVGDTGAGAPKGLSRNALMAGGGVLALVLILWAVLGGKKTGSTDGQPTPAPLTVVVVATPPPSPTAAALPTPVPALGAEGTPGPGGTPGPLGTPGAETSPAPTKKPRNSPTPTATATATPPPTATPRPADFSYSVRRNVRIAVSPDQARVFLDGKYIGIADDWDDSGGGALIVFPVEGRHRFRFSAPDRRDLYVDVNVTATAADDKIVIKNNMAPGKQEGWPGPPGNFKRPNYRTLGPARFTVEPPDAQLEVSGQAFGPVSKWADADLEFKEQAVYEIKLTAPGYEPKSLRLLVSPSAGEARAVIKEKLKKSN